MVSTPVVGVFDLAVLLSSKTVMSAVGVEECMPLWPNLARCGPSCVVVVRGPPLSEGLTRDRRQVVDVRFGVEAGAGAGAGVGHLVVFAVMDAIVGEVVSGEATGLALLEAVLFGVDELADAVSNMD